MNQPIDHVIHSIRNGGVAFVALDRGTAYLEVDGWAEREGKWHLYQGGRTPCRNKHPITNTRTRLLAAPPHGVTVCAGCRKEQP